jgi:nucleotide-binding universal stress UspA family protein
VRAQLVPCLTAAGAEGADVVIESGQATKRILELAASLPADLIVMSVRDPEVPAAAAGIPAAGASTRRRWRSRRSNGTARTRLPTTKAVFGSTRSLSSSLLAMVLK